MQCDITGYLSSCFPRICIILQEISAIVVNFNLRNMCLSLMNLVTGILCRSESFPELGVYLKLLKNEKDFVLKWSDSVEIMSSKMLLYLILCKWNKIHQLTGKIRVLKYLHKNSATQQNYTFLPILKCFENVKEMYEALLFYGKP